MMYTSYINMLTINTLTIYLYALLGGLIPGLFWLWFWMHEKHKHREPRRVIVKVFICGMLAVFISLICQKAVEFYLHESAGNLEGIDFNDITDRNYILTLIYVIIEEMTKFGAAYVIAFRTKVFNEPIDAFIYLMTAAVAFAAMENTLFLLEPLLHGETISSIVLGYTRFIGSSVLHVASSGILSVFIGLSFYKKSFIKELHVWIGLAVAVAIHWIFNVLLIATDHSFTYLVFSSVWIVTILLILSLERVKTIKKF